MSMMNMSIHAFSSLDLISCAKLISTDNVEILIRASEILKDKIMSKKFSHDEITAKILQLKLETSQHYLCTWRPKFCLDIFMYFPNDGNVIIGIPMYGPENENQIVVDIQYSHTQSLLSSDVKEVVLFGHLTCDKQENGNNTMVVLLYDLLLETNQGMDVADRYNQLLSMRDVLSDINIGETCVRVQWAGVPEAFDKISQILLPHEIQDIVLFGKDNSYARFDLFN